MNQYNLRPGLPRKFTDMTTGGIIDLVSEIGCRLEAWETVIEQGESDYLREKFRWLKCWMQEVGNSQLYATAWSAVGRGRLASQKVNAKAKEFLEVIRVLERVPDQLPEKYEALLDWVAEIPILLKSIVVDQPFLQEHVQRETYQQNTLEFPQVCEKTSHIMAY